ncbi:MAG: NusG domain II-containing protein [Blautia sp.]|nr:NusG domain II-containing protein [Blautia sp.]
MIAAILASAGIVFACAAMSHGSAAYVVAKVDGAEIGRWPLDEDTEADVDTDFGHNRIEIKAGQVRMIEADCPDGYCKNQSPVSDKGGSIVCLPHHLIIEAESSVENSTLSKNVGVDTIAK